MQRLILFALCTVMAIGARADEDAGRRLFHNGEGAMVQIPNSSTEVPATAFACAGCHGEDARGGREGGTSFPTLIEGTELRFDRASLIAAVVDGIGADGRQLATSMPRYRTDPTKLEALYTYLNTLAVTQNVGISPTILLIALPKDPALHDPFIAAIDAANRDGGAWGRIFQLSHDQETAFINGDEVMDRIDKTRLETLADVVTSELRRQNIAKIKVADSDTDFAAALTHSGAVIDPDAVFWVEQVPSGAMLRDQTGRTRLLSFAPRGSGDQTLSTEHAPAYLAAKELTHAARACGRTLTSRCILDRLDGVGRD